MICPDMVGVIGLIYKPMLGSHYTEGFDFRGMRGEQILNLLSSLFFKFSEADSD